MTLQVQSHPNELCSQRLWKRYNQARAHQTPSHIRSRIILITNRERPMLRPRKGEQLNSLGRKKVVRKTSQVLKRVKILSCRPGKVFF
ncbi:unnamed protein product [Chondrus crispus]|uniref:Uncharacterized protein n=1 Tax=Chondrus crispus TaxID=2769 RepID=R7QUG1_CHOCR|nr:unnamed protein product [Chondrus crispus]CDF41323.1 unnamed protein product [Chondrus crispus]|eukprot:XP_005711617.1 unnamed protein product [Chondrus crispus]